jgi:hypothetical protein
MYFNDIYLGHIYIYIFFLNDFFFKLNILSLTIHYELNIHAIQVPIS